MGLSNDAHKTKSTNLRASLYCSRFIARLEYNNLLILFRIIANYLEFIKTPYPFFLRLYQHQLQMSPGRGSFFAGCRFSTSDLLLIRHIRHDRLSDFFLAGLLSG